MVADKRPLSPETDIVTIANGAVGRLAMKYMDGQRVLAGGVVEIDGRYHGVVIAAIDDKSYLPGGKDWDTWAQAE